MTLATQRRYYARSASDNTDDWPFWFVADIKQGGLNVTVTLEPKIKGKLPFLPPWDAVKLAMKANRELLIKEPSDAHR